jgi:hypothetical protein
MITIVTISEDGGMPGSDFFSGEYTAILTIQRHPQTENVSTALLLRPPGEAGAKRATLFFITIPNGAAASERTVLPWQPVPA